MKSPTNTMQRQVLRLAGIAVVASVFALTGCGKKDEAGSSKAEATAPPSTAKGPATPKTATSDREVKITSIQPDNTSLIAGQTVKLAVAVAYTLPPQGGNVGIVVQDAKSAFVANKLIPVKGGSGTISEEIEFKVPATDKVSIFVPLYVKDETKSVNVSSKEYTVRPK